MNVYVGTMYVNVWQGSWAEAGGRHEGGLSTYVRTVWCLQRESKSKIHRVPPNRCTPLSIYLYRYTSSRHTVSFSCLQWFLRRKDPSYLIEVQGLSHTSRNLYLSLPLSSVCHRDRLLLLLVVWTEEAVYVHRVFVCDQEKKRLEAKN